jgi:DNA helicase-2/ATP-dependent DNA helicase PcrA
MDISYILDDLNPIQREAVTEELPYSLVLAGAGSGKTKVITHKVAWLCKVKEINPSSLMTVTFTNKAAKEMRGRIESILGEQLNQMWCGTFHGLFHRMLKMHWQEAGLAKSFSILDEATWQPRQTQWFINKQKDEGRRIAKLPNKATYVEEKMADIYLEYQKTCEEENVVDFAEILLRCYEMLAKNPKLLNHYQKRFQHILVDEFQDTNEIQYLLLKQLVGKEGEMTVVGDDDQSIYSWRGAKSSNINRFIKDFKGVKTLKLEQNYRSTTNILSAANAVIRNNPERLGKELWTEKEEGELVKIYRAFNERDEAKFIVDIIKSWVDEGRNLSECAIIYRSNAQSRILEDSILRADLPYRIYGGVRFYERLEIKNALAYAKLAIDQKNDAAFERIINIPTRGVGAKTMDQIREIAREENSSLWIAAKTFADSAGPKIANSLKTFFKLIENFSESAAKKEIEEFFENLIESSNLKNFHGKEPGEKGRSRVENLEELVSAAAGYFSIGEDADDERSQLELFLDQASLDAGENQAEENEDAIQMMTLHSSKGLEYALVFIAGCEEGLFPHKRSTEDPRQLAEERRLCYVGMTRAMERLYLTYAEVRNVYGVDGFSPASRFLKEIPEEFKYEIRMASENINKSKSFSPKIVGGTDHKVGGFALGDRVGHPSFGEGVILNYEGDGSNARVQVNFDQEGTKWLVLSFAKLNKI